VPSFKQRLAEAVTTYRDIQNPGDGGWGEDRLADAPTSIVNTVEVLAVLRAARVSYEDTAVSKAMRYLHEAVFTHPRASDGEGDEARGEHTRYCAWGVSGLTLYKEARHDRRLSDAQQHCVTWLSERQWANQGAWGEHPGDEHPSLLSTSAAVSGLSRLCSYHPAGEEAQALVLSARKVVRSLSHQVTSKGPKRTSAWSLVPGGDPTSLSPSATAMAVISLSGGEEPDRTLAREGAQWLLDHLSEWRELVEGDGAPHQANWQHMAFSLGLRAVLKGMRRDSSDPGLKGTVKYLDELWRADRGEWSHGRPKARSSPSGSYAVVTAYEAMARAWPFDASREILHERGSAESRAMPPEVQVVVRDGGSLTVVDLDGYAFDVGIPQAQLQLVSLLATRHSAGRDEGSIEARAWGLTELADELGIEIDTVRRYVQSVNQAIKRQAVYEGRSIGDLLQIPKSSSRPARRRVLINVDRVTVEQAAAHVPGSRVSDRGS
jgi:hypothetical protein